MVYQTCLTHRNTTGRLIALAAEAPLPPPPPQKKQRIPERDYPSCVHHSTMLYHVSCPPHQTSPGVSTGVSASAAHPPVAGHQQRAGRRRHGRPGRHTADSALQVRPSAAPACRGSVCVWACVFVDFCVCGFLERSVDVMCVSNARLQVYK